MNIVAFLGSQHGTKGATGRLLERAVQAAAEAGAQVRTISLADLDVAPCKACDVCHKTGECATKDDFQQIRDAMLSAEGIILASPNYLSSVTAQLKALMDRCCGIRKRVAFPEEDAERKAFAERMRELVSMRAADWPYESNV